MAVLYLTEDEVGRLVTMDLALEAVEAAFRKLALDEAENVPRQRCQTDRVMLHVLPKGMREQAVVMQVQLLEGPRSLVDTDVRLQNRGVMLFGVDPERGPADGVLIIMLKAEE